MGLAGFHRLGSAIADARIAHVRDKLARGETVYLAGLGAPGTHNSGLALVEVTQADGPRLIVNNEEERFSGNKHTTEYPKLSIDAAVATLREMGRDIGDIDAWLTSWDYPTLAGTLARSVIEELPQSFKLLRTTEAAGFDGRRLDQMTRTPKILARQLGLAERVPLICLPHHDNHAWFSYAASPFADDGAPTAIAVLDGTGDQGSISLYVVEHGAMRRLYCNDSMFNSLGAFYSVISSTQGGWTWLSSEGRYMGAAAWGDMDRASNPYYVRLRNVLHFGSDGEVRLNRAMANWYCDPFDHPYKRALTEILGEPLRPDQLWNPDAMLRVEDIHHRPDTKDRLDKAAATQLVFEDAMIHVVDHLLRTTGANRLVLTGGVALNAVGNMRLLEHFDEAWFAKAQQRDTRLQLWVPPVPGDPGVTIGAAWLFAHLAGAPRGAPMTHAFYCGTPPTRQDIVSALDADDIASQRIGDISTPEGRDAIADLMAFMVAQSGVIALYQGAAETGPRALGHRSILANPCDPKARERLNERVKYREAIRPLAPMATLEAARGIFRTAARRLGCRLQRLQLHGADGAFEAACARKNSGRHSRRWHRPHPDRARRGRSPHPCLSQGARPPYRRRAVRQHVLQCRGSHRANAAAGDRHAAPLQGTRCRGAGGRRRRSSCGVAWRRRAIAEDLPAGTRPGRPTRAGRQSASAPTVDTDARPLSLFENRIRNSRRRPCEHMRTQGPIRRGTNCFGRRQPSCFN